MAGNFRQISEEGWPPSETRPVAALRFSPDELSKKIGLVFTESDADFDTSYGAVVELPSGVTVGLFRYKNNPAPGTGLYVEENRDAGSVIAEFLASAGLEESDVTWRADQ